MVEENGDMVYNLLLEYTSSGSLRDLIHNSGGCGLPESDVKRYTKCILKGLNHIHGCGYLRCDIKPENVLLVNVSASTMVLILWPRLLMLGWLRGYGRGRR